MAKFHIKGTVTVQVITFEDIDIDDVFEGADEEEAEEAAFDAAEDDCDTHGDEYECEWSGWPEIERLPESSDEADAAERRAAYRAMVAMRAPQLPGMQTYRQSAHPGGRP
jgi:hypothetical protein